MRRSRSRSRSPFRSRSRSRHIETQREDPIIKLALQELKVDIITRAWRSALKGEDLYKRSRRELATLNPASTNPRTKTKIKTLLEINSLVKKPEGLIEGQGWHRKREILHNKLVKEKTELQNLRTYVGDEYGSTPPFDALPPPAPERSPSSSPSPERKTLDQP